MSRGAEPNANRVRATSAWLLMRVLDDQIVHQRVVHVTFEEFRDAVLFAVRANDDRPIRCLHSLAIRVPGNQGDPLAGEVGQ